jgi:broad specificity phosphatase PhoE
MTRTYTGRRSDPELSKKGEEQVSRLTRYLSSERIERIYSSPLKRALQTAEALRALSSRHIILLEDLSEMDFGLWDGLTHDQISKQYPAEYAEWINDPVGKTPLRARVSISCHREF